MHIVKSKLQKSHNLFEKTLENLSADLCVPLRYKG
jgi:hypothetical protein